MKIKKELTPKILECVVSACPAIFETDSNSYVLIDKKVDAKKLGIKERVGTDEIVVEIPKELVKNL